MNLPLLAWGTLAPQQLLLGSATTPSVVSEGGSAGFERLKSQSEFKAMKMRRFDRITLLAIYLLEHTLKPQTEIWSAIPRGDISLVIGTGLGTLETSLSCLDQMADHGDKYCSPMGFMNSVHNSIGANLAQMFDIQGQNMTFAQTQNTFDLTLLHASLLLEEHPEALVIVVGIEEMGAPLRALLSYSPQAAPCYAGVEGDICTMMVLGKQWPTPYNIILNNINALPGPRAPLHPQKTMEGNIAPHSLASAQDLVEQLLAREQGQVLGAKSSLRLEGQR